MKLLEVNKHHKRSYDDIDSWLDDIVTGTWSFRKEKINVQGSVNIHSSLFLLPDGTLPFSFGVVELDFVCTGARLSSLKGTPREVGKDFSVSFNVLESLKHGPVEVVGYYDCRKNKLPSLEGVARVIGSYLDCSYNKITDLDPLKGRELPGGLVAFYNDFPPELSDQELVQGIELPDRGYILRT